MSVGGIAVSIAAFQAVDPGSTPGHRIPLFYILIRIIISFQCIENSINIILKVIINIF